MEHDALLATEPDCPVCSTRCHPVPGRGYFVCRGCDLRVIDSSDRRTFDYSATRPSTGTR